MNEWWLFFEWLGNFEWMNGFCILFPLIYFHFLYKMEADSAVNIGRLCFLDMKEGMGPGQISTDPVLSLSYWSFKWACWNKGLLWNEVCWKHWEMMTQFLKHRRFTRICGNGQVRHKQERAFQKTLGLLQHNKQIKLLMGFLMRPLAMPETSVSTGQAMAGREDLATAPVPCSTSELLTQLSNSHIEDIR